MPINFPDSPSVNDTHTVGDKTWTWDGTSWNVVTAASGDHGNLAGLSDDDHTQYLRVDGTRSADSLTISDDLTVDTDTLHVDSANNRVGIGTTVPAQALDVVGNITVSGTVDGRDVASDGTKLDGIESGATADQTASEILTAIKTVDGTGSGLDADTLDGFDSSQFVRSDASDSMTGTLTIQGNGNILQLESTVDTSRSTIKLITNGSDWEIGARGSLGNPNNTLYVYDSDSSAYRMVIDTSGNVGIGTTSPARGPLHIHRTDTNPTELHMTNGESGASNTDGFTLFYDDTSAGAGVWMREAGPLRFATSGSERVRIDSSGRVGVGTTEPAQELHVYTGSANADVRLQGDPTGYLDVYHGPTLAGLHASNAVTMRFATNNTNRMLIDSSGRVTMPYQPSFKAILGTGQTYGGSGGTNLAFNNVLWNIGNHYNSSTGIFTAPVSGTYVVGAALVQSTSATGFIVIEWLVNGVKTPGGQTIPPNTSSSVSSGEGGVSTAGTVYLSANDTLQLIMYKSYTGNLGNGGGGVDWGEGRNFFSAALLG